MRPLLIAGVLALVAVSLYAAVWHRPDPKHALLFSLVERLPADSTLNGTTKPESLTDCRLATMEVRETADLRS